MSVSNSNSNSVGGEKTVKTLKLPSFIYGFIYGVFPKFYIRHLNKIGAKIGKGTMFYGQVTIDETVPNLIEIGSKCVLTNGVTILTHDWIYPILQRKYGSIPDVFGASKKVIIGDSVYIGTNAIILKGVTIGSYVIIGAGSIVTHSIPDNCVAAGNPCKVISSLDDYYEKHKTESNGES